MVIGWQKLPNNALFRFFLLGIIMTASSIEVPPNAGGPDIATDEIGGRHHQVIKICIGGPGEAGYLGPVPMPVQAESLPLPDGASTNAALYDLKASIDTLNTTLLATTKSVELDNNTLIALQRVVRDAIVDALA